MTAVRTAYVYITAYAVVGFLFLLLDTVTGVFKPIGMGGDLQTLANIMWDGTVVVFMLFSPFWFVNKLKEWRVVE